jgi:hypothetical protein
MSEQPIKKVHIIPRGKVSRKLLSAIAVLVATLALSPEEARATSVANGSFETGDFSDWVTQDLLTPYVPLQVGGAGLSPLGFDFFRSAPTDGNFAALHGFDGDGPGIIRIGQDIAVTADGNIIEFDYRAAWNLVSYCFGCLDRIFDVNIEVPGGGANLDSFNILTATAGTIELDTGDVTGVVDLSAFVGQAVRLSFDFLVPQDFTGPAFFQLDNIRVIGPPPCFAIDAIDDQFSVVNDGAGADLLALVNDECSSDAPISVVVLPGDLLPDRGGSATTDGATVHYTPAAGFIGFEEFTYTAQDAGLEGGDDPPAVDQDTATVVVNVVEDITPDAVDDVATALQDQALIIDVLQNDSLGNTPNGVEIETGPANGSATVEPDNSIRYSPNANFFGEDSFEYRLIDANGDSDVATVKVCVFFGSGHMPIDIMPSDPGNNLNLRAGKGASISVAVLSVGGFCGAPNLIDPLTLKFGPGQTGISGNPQFRDVDGDGDEDLVVKFLIQQTGIPCGDTQASLFGRTFDTQPISGSDAINTFNCPRIRKRH